MFNLNTYPYDAVHFFFMDQSSWPEAVLSALAGGVEDVDKLTDLAFYMHHPELMDGDMGRSLTSGMRHFDDLVEQWNDLKTEIEPLLRENAADQEIAPASDWHVPVNVQRGVKRLAGQSGLDWVMKPPSASRHVKEFLPARQLGAKTEAILLWKSSNPEQNCFCRVPERRRARVQLVKLWSTDLRFWQRKTPTRLVAEMITQANVNAARDFRHLVLSRKICPSKAIEMVADEDRRAMGDLVWASFHFLSPFGIPNAPLTESVAGFLGTIAGVMEKAAE